MIRTRFAAIAAFSLIALSAPAFAQMDNGMKADNMPDTCQGMMDKASPMMDSMSDGNKKMMAMKQMDMAKTSMAAGREKTCMMHMHKAMNMM
jgi:hypothetical protein